MSAMDDNSSAVTNDKEIGDSDSEIETVDGSDSETDTDSDCDD